MRAFFNSTLNRLVLAYGLGLLLAFVVIGVVSLLAFDRLVERREAQPADQREGEQERHAIGQHQPVQAGREQVAQRPGGHRQARSPSR